MRSLFIGAAGFVGAVTRYHVDGLVGRKPAGTSFPWGTFAVNISGCFLLGLLAALFTERFLAHEDLRSAITVGFLGAYTTFSTFAYESLRLAEEGSVALAALNIGLSVIVGLVAAWAGLLLGRAV